MNSPVLRAPIPDHYFTPPSEVDQLIADLRLQADGHNVLYSVDSTDVIDYCFPLNPYHSGEPDLDALATDQTALDELFTKARYRPILIPHYVGELTEHFYFVRNSADSAWQDLEICRRMTEGLNIEQESTLEGTPDERVGRASQNFVRKLAVWMGIDSIGAARFQHVISKSLKRLSDLGVPYIEEAAKSLRSRHAPEIYRVLREEAERYGDPVKLPKRLKTAQTDAAAIDWLINLNAVCEEGFLAGKLPARYVFLYLSSAPRTRKIFADKAVRAALPRINGQPFPFWRSRRQLLLLASATRNAGEDSTKIIENLEQSRSVCERVGEIELAFGASGAADCGSCVLRGRSGSPTCPWKEACEKVLSINEASIDISNLGLLARIRAYSDLLRARPKLREQKEFLGVLKTLVDNKELPDLALRRIEDRQVWALTNSVAAQRLTQPEGPIISTNNPTTLPEPFRHLPLTYPKIFGEYQQIAQFAYSYCSCPREDITRRHELVRLSMGAFLAIDNVKPYPGGRDHELTRLLLFVCFGGSSGFRDVLERSRSLMEIYDNDRYSFMYPAIIAAQELGLLQETHNLCRDALALRPAEPVLYHIRSVNTFAWHRDARMRDLCPLKMAQAVADARKACALYEQDPSKQMLVAIEYNNLAYFHSFSNDHNFKDIYDLHAAVTYLEKLTALPGWPEFSTQYPAFLHTVAHVELLAAKADSNYDNAGLQRALAAIERAISIQDTPLYQITRAEILKEEEARTAAKTRAVPRLESHRARGKH